jgi:hypothetical protein
MKKQHTSFGSSLRFRRWSRKAYAAFVSIQHNVTIGALNVHLVERLQKKNQIEENESLNCLRTEACVSEKDEEVETLFLNHTLLLLAATTQVQSIVAAQPFYVKQITPKG